MRVRHLPAGQKSQQRASSVIVVGEGSEALENERRSKQIGRAEPMAETEYDAEGPNEEDGQVGHDLVERQAGPEQS